MRERSSTAVRLRREVANPLIVSGPRMMMDLAAGRGRSIKFFARSSTTLIGSAPSLPFPQLAIDMPRKCPRCGAAHLTESAARAVVSQSVSLNIQHVMHRDLLRFPEAVTKIQRKCEQALIALQNKCSASRRRTPHRP
jgi:hypothetical protein